MYDSVPSSSWSPIAPRQDKQSSRQSALRAVRVKRFIGHVQRFLRCFHTYIYIYIFVTLEIGEKKCS